jgi:hypothetical protein
MAKTDSTTFISEAQAKRPIDHTIPCKFEGCDRWAWAQGYCGTHYHRMKREGIIKTKRVMKDDLARFHTKYVVNEDTGCWNWIGVMHPSEYGHFGITVNGKVVQKRAHRFSFEKLVGPIPHGEIIRHICNNRKCVNPDHLKSGTSSDNMQDCLRSGRHCSQTGNTQRKITKEMALNIRVMYARSLPFTYGNEKNPYCIRNIAVIYGVTHQAIRQILKGEAHLWAGG